MKIKKILASVLGLALTASVFAGCSSGSGSGSGSASGDLIKVGIINNDPNESGYRTANDKDMKATFTEENGYDASFAYSLKNDEQIAAAQTFIQSEVDYLLISAAGTSGWDSVLKDAQAQGIKVILFDRTIDADESLYEASIVSDMAKEGQTAVDWLASQGLSEYNIVHIQGTMGSAAQVGRTGALDTKVAENDSWNLVTQQTADWNAETAQQIVQSIIDSGTSFNVIYAENDDMAKGAVAALDKANISHGVGKDVIVMGFDCNKWALENLLSGSWNYDGQCNPFQASYIDSIIKDPTKKGIHISHSLHFLHTVASTHGSPFPLPCLQINSIHIQILLALLCFHSVATFHTNQQQTGIVVPIYSSYDATSHWAVASIGNPPIHLRLLIVTDSPHS